QSANAATATDNFAFTTFLTEAAITSVPAWEHGTIVDSGATSHYCPDRSKFSTFTTIDPRLINIADGHTIYATGHGNVIIDLPKGDGHSCIMLNDTLYVPDITFTLISTSHTANAGFSVHMSKGTCEIWSPDPSRLVTCIPEVDRLYCLSSVTKSAATSIACPPKTKLTLRQLHKHMRHISFSVTQTMLSKGLVE
ncbi:hypothetical protein V8B97DRAFT_1846409, partial [Scleroderma yunnanense]